MITEKAFWKGRDTLYEKELTSEIRANAAEAMRRVNLLLDLFYEANPKASKRDANSGWRPPVVNAGTKGSSKTSHHMMGRAIDVDDDDEALDKWLLTNNGLLALVKCELWLEHPRDTPRWCHLQTVPPGSKRRVFYAK